MKSYPSLFLIFHFFLINLSSWDSTAHCVANQSSLLLKLKHGFLFQTDSKRTLSSWIPGSSDCCSWEGLTCDNTTGLVIGLNLSSPNSLKDRISGKIDPSLFHLRSLRTLDLSYNNFDPCPFPSGLGNLTRLTYLNFSNAGFTGEIDPSFFRLHSLQTLDLSHNNLYPFPIPSGLGNLTSLIHLNLADASFSRVIDPSFFRLHNLRTLDLSSNFFNLSPIPSGIGNLTRLTHLNLASTGFSGQIPLQISRLTRLVSLDLTGNYELKVEYPNLKTLLHNLTTLQELYLDDVNISTYEWSTAISSSLPNLRVLSMADCSLSGPIDLSLLRLPFLTQLLLDGNTNLSFLNSTDSFSDYNSSKLRDINIFYCNLTGRLPENIFRLPNLHTLYLSFNYNLAGTFPSFLPTNNYLEFLHLRDTMLSGSLPESIGNLKSLKELDLRSSNFSGPVPSSLKDLTQLETLFLQNNSFNGQIPPLLSPSIVQIDLSHNYLAGVIPPSLLALPSLQALDLSHNQLGSFPSFITDLTSLQTLDLSHNQLIGSIPSAIADLIQLIKLDLSYNNFNGTITIGLFQNIKNLSALYLSGNNLTLLFDNASINGVNSHFPQIEVLHIASCNIKEFSGFLRGQKYLRDLDLYDNKLMGDIPNWMWRVGEGNLAYLNLSHNMLTGVETPINLSTSFVSLDLHSNNLEGFLPVPPYSAILDYSNNKFSCTIPFNIGQSLQNTRFLSLSDNKFTGELPTSICDGVNLEFLDMSNNNFSGPIPKCLATFNTYISVLKLRGNNLHGTIPNGFINGSSLRTLDLNSNRFSGPIPRSLANCSMLEVLDLGNNGVNDTFPSWLQNLPQLRVLVLRSNQLHGTIEQGQIHLGFHALQIIDISSNSLIGNLPKRFFTGWKGMMIDGEDRAKSQTDYFLKFTTPWSGMYYQDAVTITNKGQEMQFIKILTTLCVIDFSNNRFNGSIPEELGILTSLRVLNLSRNILNGTIAQSFENLSNIESMDLSNNHLSGRIPTELTRLSFLSVFDVSHNRLYGRIPEGNQFSTFSSASFEGNQGLCGFPLSSECKTPPPTLAGNGETTDDKEGFDWELYLMAGLGYIGGLGFALGISCSRRRERYC